MELRDAIVSAAWKPDVQGRWRDAKRAANSWHTARRTLFRMKNEQRIQRVNLHLALGGGFSAEAAPQQDGASDP